MGLAAKTYAEQLGCYQYGHPLWFPEPSRGLDGRAYEVHIGDVGYIDEDGAFRRLFNITVDAGHFLNGRGVPEGFIPIEFDHENPDDFKPNFLGSCALHSSSVTSHQIDAQASATAGGIASAGLSYRFECKKRAGAILVLPHSATKSSIGFKPTFEKYMLENHGRWHSFALQFNRFNLEDIILVRGTVKTSAWALGAIFDAGDEGHEITFSGQFDNFGSAGLRYSQLRGTICSFEQRIGPRPPSLSSNGQVPPVVGSWLTEDQSFGSDDQFNPAINQCVFVNYYKIKYRVLWAKKIVANADVPGQPGSHEDHGELILGSEATGGDSNIEIVPDVPRDSHSDAEVAIASHADLEGLLSGTESSEICEILDRLMPKVVVDDSNTGRVQNVSHSAKEHLSEDPVAGQATAVQKSKNAASNPMSKAITQATEQRYQQRGRDDTYNSIMPNPSRSAGHAFHSFSDFEDPTALPGVIVPQKTYSARISYLPRSTVKFSESGRPGVNLHNALTNNLSGLADRSRSLVLADTTKRVTIRINWPGYPTWSDMQHVYDHKVGRIPITMQGLALAVARKVKLCLEELQRQPSTELTPDWWATNWSLERLVLLELRNVSRGSWQPVLCGLEARHPPELPLYDSSAHAHSSLDVEAKSLTTS